MKRKSKGNNNNNNNLIIDSFTCMNDDENENPQSECGNHKYCFIFALDDEFLLLHVTLMT